ncbi:unnamed protein product [Rotaria socialis]|uniref:Uncharacterized protein n=1 Tax=Rotaria socialis TaxID=392032 RepID=A0A817XK48_9BILA|nr:unnamed protein product [Rotaria socialis]CAF3357035.1 unnamed protein product [Rotaria socialis]CAF3370351.1 unnamed protein product [Rotaria socialis]
MASMDSEAYRLIPYRFFVDDTKSNTCKLEKLTNLFPDLKPVIELELFKINNISQTIGRLSQIYSAKTFVDNRDDTLHILLGPYHLALGPVIFGALHFRNVSAALLASSQAKLVIDGTYQSSIRRREAILRRFRHAVRKLIFIKSVIDQAQIASILTPYNQYELYKQGIYDLALAGQIHNSNSIFDDENFIQRINNVRLMNSLDKENPLLASKYIKINSLLNLLASTVSQQQSGSNLPTENMIRSRSDTAASYSTNEDDSKTFLNSTTLCCEHHNTNQESVAVPMNRSSTYYFNHLLSHEPLSKPNSRKGSQKSSTASSSQNNITIVPDWTPNDITVSSSTPVELDKMKNTSQVTDSHKEDILIYRISSLLLNYLSSLQSTSVTADIDHAPETLNDNEALLTAITEAEISNNSNRSDPSSTIVNADQFNHLLGRIQTIVSNNLSTKLRNNKSMFEKTVNPQNRSSNSIKTAIKNRRRQLFASRTISLQETTINEFDVENSESSDKKHKLELTLKSQSFDEMDLNLSLLSAESNNNWR